jgi:hypothetical protein
MAACAEEAAIAAAGMSARRAFCQSFMLDTSRVKVDLRIPQKANDDPKDEGHRKHACGRDEQRLSTSLV